MCLVIMQREIGEKQMICIMLVSLLLKRTSWPHGPFTSPMPLARLFGVMTGFQGDSRRSLADLLLFFDDALRSSTSRPVLPHLALPAAQSGGCSAGMDTSQIRHANHRISCCCQPFTSLAWPGRSLTPCLSVHVMSWRAFILLASHVLRLPS